MEYSQCIITSNRFLVWWGALAAERGRGGGGVGEAKKKLKFPLLFKQSKEVLPLPSPSACEDWGEKQHN